MRSLFVLTLFLVTNLAMGQNVNHSMDSKYIAIIDTKIPYQDGAFDEFINHLELQLNMITGLKEEVSYNRLLIGSRIGSHLEIQRISGSISFAPKKEKIPENVLSSISDVLAKFNSSLKEIVGYNATEYVSAATYGPIEVYKSHKFEKYFNNITPLIESYTKRGLEFRSSGCNGIKSYLASYYSSDEAMKLIGILSNGHQVQLLLLFQDVYFVTSDNSIVFGFGFRQSYKSHRNEAIPECF